MARWSEIEAEAPELAAAARGFLDAHVHKTLATLRRDGSPRISGSETVWHDGDLYVGSMGGGMKALDLLRDARFALHSGSKDPDDGWSGDAKVAGTMEDITDTDVRAAVLHGDATGDAHVFRADISELVVVGLNEERTMMVVESWHEGRGYHRFERE
jgi:hypothetical protein